MGLGTANCPLTVIQSGEANCGGSQSEPGGVGRPCQNDIGTQRCDGQSRWPRHYGQPENGAIAVARAALKVVP